MKEQKLISLLGLAQKAGKIASGELAVEKTVRSGKAQLVILAEDSSENTKKAYRDMARYYSIPIYELLSKEQLGICIGKMNRAALSVMDAGFAKAIKALLDVH
jgi:ribosomal protein L7Ae-like RNA K-turn-binding protein